jgi:antitoxin component of MazEF toxin-antitoxin module
MDGTYKIRSVGGALVVTIPRHIQKLNPVQAGDEVRFTIAANHRRGSRPFIIIEPMPRKNGVKK